MSEVVGPLKYTHVNDMSGENMLPKGPDNLYGMEDEELDRRALEQQKLVQHPELLTPRQFIRAKNNLGRLAYEQWSRFKDDEGTHIEMHRKVSGGTETVLWVPEEYEPNPEVLTK